ncbi:sel1 repeat family protein [Gammaproteobacteria bacterium]|nr:sel1 repeat family protein [Gammaproteobacteria bacterium]
MKRLLLLCTLLISFTSFADELSDAEDAYVRGDYTTAITSFKKLAEQGYAGAQNNLGAMYQNGFGTPQDYKAAIKLYTKSAEQGDATAQFNLGVMYGKGEGTPQDYVMAHMLWNIAAANGNEDAKEVRDIVAKEMTSEKILEAQQLAKEWMKKY